MRVYNQNGSEVSDVHITNNLTSANGKFDTILLKNATTGQYMVLTGTGAPGVQQINIDPIEST